MPRNLTTGCTGADVRALQQLLNFHLYPPRWKPLVADGTFGPHTRARVFAFQDLNDLEVDGIVGIETRQTLLDSRTFEFTGQIAPNAQPAQVAAARPAPFAVTQAGPSQPPSPPPPPAVPNGPTQRTVQINMGQQLNVNPFFVQPLVIGGQVTWMFRRDGSFDNNFTVAGQFALNQQTGPRPNGGWSGQGSVQWGPTGILKLGNFDLLNPFVAFMLTQNQGQPPQVGMGIGNQINWTLWSAPHPTIPNVDATNIGLFVNGQLVTNTFLPFGGAPPPGSPPPGQFSAPGGQILAGVTWTMDWTPRP